MAKVQKKCPVCAGTWDGTPSGFKTHIKTQKHALAESTQAKVKPARAGIAAMNPPRSFRRGIAASVTEDAAPPTEAQADPQSQPESSPKAEPAEAPASVATKPDMAKAAQIQDAKKMVARYKQYVAYAAKPDNHVKAENKARYSGQLEKWTATLAELTS